MYLPYQFMSALEDDRLRAAARGGRSAAARREHRQHRRLRGTRRNQRAGRRPEQILSPRTAG